MKQIISIITRSLPEMDEAAKTAIEKALWQIVPKVLKDNALNKTILTEAFFGAVVPHDNDIEIAVLARALAYPNIALVSCNSVNAACFYEPMNQFIWTAISALWKGKKVVASDTVLAWLQERGYQCDVMYLDSLPKSAPANTDYTWSEFTGLISTLTNNALMRSMYEQCLQAIEGIFKSPADEAPALRANILQALSNLQTGSVSRMQDGAALGDTLTARYEKQKQRLAEGGTTSGVPIPFAYLSKLTGGWQPSDLIVLAARPSMGKTAALLKMLLHAAEQGEPVAFFSLEMSSDALVQRLFCIKKEIAFEKFRDTSLNPQEERELLDFALYFATLPFFIDDTSSINPQYVEDQTAKLVKDFGVKMIGVDYIQIMVHNDPRFKRDIEIASCASRGLKAVAKKFNIVVIALSQLSRAVEQRGGDKKPMLSDLRDSGTIEQDADLVIFVYRAEYYGITEDEEGKSMKGIGQLIISKHRNGGLGCQDCFFDARYASFKETWELPADYADVAPQSIPEDWIVIGNGGNPIDVSDIKF